MQLNFKRFGEGPSLIILHGLFGSLDNWQTLARKYAEDFSVYIVDQRNHGKSPHSDEMFDYNVMADDLADFMDTHRILSASFIGHSMGGKTVMQFAVERPDRVDKLVVADMSPRPNEGGHEEILETLQAFPFDRIDARKEAEEWLEPRIKEYGVRQFLLKNLDRDKEGFRWKFNLEVIVRDYAHILAGVQSPWPVSVPALFIRGGKSDYIRNEDEVEISEMFPEAEFATIEGAGHWLHAEKPMEFLEATREFLLR